MRGTRWVLKCPDHVFALGAIKAVYPDARVVFVHRDPLRVLLSLSELTEVLRRPFTRHIDRCRIGPHESDRWLEATELMIEADEQQPFAEPICHIHYRSLVEDPLGSVATIYRHFGLTLDANASGANQVGCSVETRWRISHAYISFRRPRPRSGAGA